MHMPEFVPAPATLPPGQRVYAVGDTHGCLEQVTALHALIAQDLNDRPIGQCSLIHLGDYVDRGPDCAQLIGVLTAGRPVPGVMGRRGGAPAGGDREVARDGDATPE